MSRSNKDYIRRRAAEEEAEANARFYETDEDRAKANTPKNVDACFAQIEQKLKEMHVEIVGLSQQASLARVHQLATDLVALKHTIADLSKSLALQLALNEQAIAAERAKWEIDLLQAIYKGDAHLRGHRIRFID
jgi:hypothetical protein